MQKKLLIPFISILFLFSSCLLGMESKTKKIRQSNNFVEKLPSDVLWYVLFRYIPQEVQLSKLALLSKKCKKEVYNYFTSVKTEVPITVYFSKRNNDTILGLQEIKERKDKNGELFYFLCPHEGLFKEGLLKNGTKRPLSFVFKDINKKKFLMLVFQLHNKKNIKIVSMDFGHAFPWGLIPCKSKLENLKTINHTEKKGSFKTEFIFKEIVELRFNNTVTDLREILYIIKKSTKLEKLNVSIELGRGIRFEKNTGITKFKLNCIDFEESEQIIRDVLVKFPKLEKLFVSNNNNIDWGKVGLANASYPELKSLQFRIEVVDFAKYKKMNDSLKLIFNAFKGLKQLEIDFFICDADDIVELFDDDECRTLFWIEEKFKKHLKLALANFLTEFKHDCLEKLKINLLDLFSYPDQTEVTANVMENFFDKTKNQRKSLIVFQPLKK